MAATSEETFQGRVKWFNPKAGYGFITLLNSDTEDVFVHHSGLCPKKECFKTLYQGEYVSLTIMTDNTGKKFGTTVTGISGNELMCERFADNGESVVPHNPSWNTVTRRRPDNHGGDRGGGDRRNTRRRDDNRPDDRRRDEHTES